MKIIWVKNINISKSKIQANDYNNDVNIEGTEKEVVIQYFSEYRTKNAEWYKNQHIRNWISEYAEKKFGQYSNFESYVKIIKII